MQDWRLFVLPNTFGLNLPQKEFYRLFGEGWRMVRFGEAVEGTRTLLIIFPTLESASRCGVTRDEWRKYHDQMLCRLIPEGRMIYT